MIVRFPLNVVGSSSFTVMILTMIHMLWCAHARMLTFSCHMCTGGLALYCRDRQRKILRLQRRKELIDSQIENASHDFDIIKQEGCEHGKEKVLNIDVDKILGLKGDSGLRDAIESVASEFEFNQKSVEDIKEEAKDII